MTVCRFPPTPLAIDGDDVPQPKGCKGVSLEIGKPGKTRPCEYPGDNAKKDPCPTPPWERENISRGCDAFAMVSPCQMDEEGSNQCKDKEGIGQEDGPGERRMLDIGCLRRKLQVKGDLLFGGKDPQDRKPQEDYRQQG